MICGQHDPVPSPAAFTGSKLIVIGPILENRWAHYFNEMLGYKTAAEALGRRSRILVPRESSAHLVSLLSATPSLDVVPHIEIGPETLFGGLVAFADGHQMKSTEAAIDAEDPDQTDILLFTSIHPALVRGIGIWLASRSPERRPSVFFRFLGSECVNLETGDYNSQAPLYRLASSDLRTRPGQERVFFIANNPACQRATSRVCDRRTFLMPMPKYLGEAQANAPQSEFSNHTIYVSLKNRSGRLAGQLSEIIRRVRVSNPTVKFLAKFSGNIEAADIAFRHERVANVEALPIGEDAVDYLENLARSSVVVQAYEPQSYQMLTSGVFTECVSLGKPVVVPNGTWMADQIAAGRGAGVVYDEPTVEAVSAAVVQSLQAFDRLSAAAREIAPRIRAENSCQRVIELLLEMSQTTPNMEPRCHIGDEIDLRDAFESRVSKHDGWGQVEPWGVWTTGPSAGLSFKVDPGGGKRPLTLRALVLPFLAAEHPRTTVRVEISGQHVAEWVFDVSAPAGAGLRWCEAPIPAQNGEDHSEQLDIRFHIDTPMSPSALGLSGDTRTLGIGLQKLLLSAID